MTVTILGGGIAGLSGEWLVYFSVVSEDLIIFFIATHYLLKQGVTSISLLESSGKFGGWIRSKQVSRNGENFFFECGPRTLRPRGLVGNTTLELIEEIGLSEKVLPIKSSHLAAKNRMIFAKNQVCLLPNSPAGIFKTIPPFSKPLFVAGFKDIFTGGTKLDDESIYDFAKRRFGQELADYAVGSLICGICAGDAKEISVNFLMKDLFKIEQKYGGVVRGVLLNSLFNKSPKPEIIESNLFKRAKSEKWAIFSMIGGLQTIPDKLTETLQGNSSISLQTEANCQELSFQDSGEIRMKVNGKDHIAQHLVSSIPSYRLGKLLESQHPQLAEELKEIKFVNVCVINLQYNDPDLLKHKGFGVLVPPIENLPVLGVIFDSCCFDIKNNTVLTAMMGGKWFEERFGKNPSKEQLLEIALVNIEKILGIKQKPDLYNVNILEKCIPQYVIGHTKQVENIKRYIEAKKLPITLCGASYDGVGVNDVIHNTKNAINSLKL